MQNIILNRLNFGNVLLDEDSSLGWFAGVEARMDAHERAQTNAGIFIWKSRGLNACAHPSYYCYGVLFGKGYCHKMQTFVSLLLKQCSSVFSIFRCC